MNEIKFVECMHESDTVRELREKLGWLELASSGMEKIWDNPRDGKEWDKYT